MLSYRTRYCVWWYRVLLGGTYAMFAVFLGVPAAGYVVPVGVLVGAPFAILAVRAARSGLWLSDDGVVARGVFRTRRASWEQIVSAAVGQGSSTGLPWRIPVIVLDRGAIRVEDVRSLREPSIVDEAVAAVLSRLERTQPPGDGIWWEGSGP